MDGNAILGLHFTGEHSNLRRRVRGATCFYPHVDLMIRNDTAETFQLCLTVEKEDLVGEWRVLYEPTVKYEVIERNHEMRLHLYLSKSLEVLWFLI